jgi:hypothetical protein
VAEATVVVQNTETGLKQTTMTGASGIYTVPQMPPGTYTRLGEACRIRTRKKAYGSK